MRRARICGIQQNPIGIFSPILAIGILRFFGIYWVDGINRIYWVDGINRIYWVDRINRIKRINGVKRIRYIRFHTWITHPCTLSKFGLPMWDNLSESEASIHEEVGAAH